MEYAVIETAGSILFLENINLKVRKTKLNDDIANIMKITIIRFIRSITVVN